MISKFDNKIFLKLSKDLQKFILEIDNKYRFTFQETRQVIDIASDLNMWQEDSLEKLFIDDILVENINKQLKKNKLKQLLKKYEEIKSTPKDYSNLKFVKSDRKVELDYGHKDSLGLGKCPVASEKTRCCNLMTLDAVEGCAFDCSYCSIQSFYNENKVFIDLKLEDKLKNINLDPNKTYHIGTGQSSDSLLWGNKAGVLDALFKFARDNTNVILEMKTKSNNIKYFLENDVPKNILCTFSLNPQIIVDNEEHLTASLENRLKAARHLSDKGVVVGFHFHPMVYFKDYQKHYGEVFTKLVNMFKSTEVALISFGTLTFIKPVIKKIKARDFQSKILQMPHTDASGKVSYDLETKEEMFSFAYNSLLPWHNKVYFYLCMEDKSLWKKVFGYEYKDNEEMEKAMISSYLNTIN